MRWPSAHSNQLRLGGAREEVRDEDLARRTTWEGLILNGRRGRRCGETTSIDRCVGPSVWPRPDCLRASGSAICATQETRWRPRRGRAHGS
jgi:hypothetical protein